MPNDQANPVDKKRIKEAIVRIAASYGVSKKRVTSDF
jgi:hypothetical protein